MKHLKLFVMVVALGGLAGCESIKQAQTKVSSGFSNTKEKVVKTGKSAKSKVSKQAAVVTGGLVGEDEYEKAVKKARRRYKKMPTGQICWQARQEIAQSWELFKANKRFIRKNSLGSTGSTLWKAFTSNLYKTVDNAVPLPLPDLPEDRIQYAAKQVEFNRKNIEEWSAIYAGLCKK
jgi:hypothetical protein